MPSPLKAFAVTAAYAVTVGGVGAALVLSADADATPWLAVLAGMAVVHLGFGLIVARWSAALLPLVASIGAVLLDVGGFSVTTLLVGVPCSMLLVAGVALRIGWDGGRPRRSEAGRHGDDEDEPSTWDDTAAWDASPAAWDDAVA